MLNALPTNIAIHFYNSTLTILARGGRVPATLYTFILNSVILSSHSFPFASIVSAASLSFKLENIKTLLQKEIYIKKTYILNCLRQF